LQTGNKALESAFTGKRWSNVRGGKSICPRLCNYDIPIVRSYVYDDVQFTAERYAKPKLLEFDPGFATRPFSQLENLEFRVGNDVTVDVESNTTRDLVYGAVRIGY